MTTKILRTLSAAFFLLFSFSSYSQSSGKAYEISGKVIDNELNVPLEYATISIVDVNDPEKINGGVTNAEGVFNIDAKPGTYNIIVEFISYETKRFNNRDLNSNLNLGTIELGISSNNLDEVVVRAETT